MHKHQEKDDYEILLRPGVTRLEQTNKKNCHQKPKPWVNEQKEYSCTYQLFQHNELY